LKPANNRETGKETEIHSWGRWKGTGERKSNKLAAGTATTTTTTTILTIAKTTIIITRTTTTTTSAVRTATEVYLCPRPLFT